MTPEEIQRTMEFLLAQQARFDGRLEKLAESQATQANTQATLTASLLRIADFIEDLSQAQIKNEERFSQIEERFRQTDERFRQTDERLNALITVVEKHITGHDHGSKPS